MQELLAPFYLTTILGSIFYGLGTYICRFTKAQINGGQFFYKSVFGLASISIFATLGYVIGTNLNYCLITICILSAWGLYLDIKGFLKANNRYTFYIKVSYIWFIALVLSVGCFAIGGRQFYVFQGNHYDTFNYIESALTYRITPYKLLTSEGIPWVVYHNGFPYAIKNNLLRPTISILAGMLYGIDIKHFFLISACLMNYCLFLTGGTVALLIRNMLNLKDVITILVGVSFYLGFWGQYIFDINAWSQTTWMPVILLLIYEVFEISNAKATNSVYINTNSTILFSILAIGSFYLYPEGGAFFIPAIIFGIISTCYRYRTFKISPTYICGGGALLIFLTPVWRSNVASLFVQFKNATTENTFWHFFDAPFLGLSGLSTQSLILRYIDVGSGVLGFYFLTPSTSASLFIAVAERVITLVIYIIIISQVIINYKQLIKSKQYSYLGVVSSILFLEITLLLYRKNYWGAGKAFSYFSPIFLILITANLLSINTRRSSYRLASIICFWFITLGNIFFGIYRPIAVYKSKTGIHYDSPYPSVQDAGYMKRIFDFNDISFTNNLREGERVTVDIKDPWIEAYTEMELLSRGVVFQTPNRISLETGYDRYMPVKKLQYPLGKVITLYKDERRYYPYFIGIANP